MAEGTNARGVRRAACGDAKYVRRMAEGGPIDSREVVSTTKVKCLKTAVKL